MKIDILGKSEEKIKMQKMAVAIQQAASNVNIPVTINFTHNFMSYSGSSMNPVMTPHVFIEGNLEFSGSALPIAVMQKKLVEYRDKGS